MAAASASMTDSLFITSHLGQKPTSCQWKGMERAPACGQLRVAAAVVAGEAAARRCGHSALPGSSQEGAAACPGEPGPGRGRARHCPVPPARP